MRAPDRVSRWLIGFCLLAAGWCWAAIPTFQHQVLPLIEKRCIACHGGGPQLMAGLDLRTLAAVMAGSSNGPVIVPGNPDGSRLWMMVRGGKMPMGGPPLTHLEKQLIQEWIEKGQFPARGGPPGQWWSFRKPVKPPVPAVRASARLRTPIDAFIQQKLDQKKWTFSKDADKRTLLRRAHFDLLGLPPNPDEVGEFLADSSVTRHDCFPRRKSFFSD